MLQFYIPEVVAVEQIFDEADEMQVGKYSTWYRTGWQLFISGEWTEEAGRETEEGRWLEPLVSYLLSVLKIYICHLETNPTALTGLIAEALANFFWQMVISNW